MLHWAWSAVTGRVRNPGADGHALLRACRVRTEAYGLDNVPPARGLIVVMNHYERPGLRVWWPGFFVSMLLWRLRPASPVRWMVANRWEPYRLGPVLIPRRLIAGFPYLLVRTHGAIIVPRQSALSRSRALALRRAARALGGDRAATVAITPELVTDLKTALTDPWPNAGAALALLSRGQVPILPVAVYEGDSAQLIARVGPSFTLAWEPPRDAATAAALNREIMCRLAALLPPELRGTFDTVPPARLPMDG
ncbi:MAG: hypothetical protein AB7I38_08045 [Dehalococcoidia bacterium]